MGRSYAGILGPIAFCSVLVQGFFNGAVTESILFRAWMGLVVFAAIGYVSGRLAGWIVEDSVRARVTAEVAADKQAAETLQDA